MLRRRPYLLPLLGSSLLVGGLVGVQLGESAIAGINPIHFAGLPEPPRVFEPPPPGAARSAYLDAHSWQEGLSARASDCGNCAVSYETYAFARDEPEARLTAQDWRVPVTTAEPESWPPGRVAVHRGGDLMRYADYPIEEKPTEIEPAERIEFPDYQAADIYED